MHDRGPFRATIARAVTLAGLLRSGPNIGGPSDDRSVIADLEAE